MSKLSNLVLKRAQETLGVHEDGRSNSGKWIDQYLAFVGLPPGNPWCAAYVCFRIHKAAVELGVPTSWPKTGLCQSIYTWAKRKGLVHKSPQPGDVFLQWHSDLGRYSHTGFVRAVVGQTFTTIEGNSNDEGSREGYEVCSNVRPLTPKKYVFVRIPG